jgi:hypothetical protein
VYTLQILAEDSERLLEEFVRTVEGRERHAGIALVLGSSKYPLKRKRGKPLEIWREAMEKAVEKLSPLPMPILLAGIGKRMLSVNEEVREKFAGTPIRHYLYLTPRLEKRWWLRKPLFYLPISFEETLEKAVSLSAHYFSRALGIEVEEIRAAIQRGGWEAEKLVQLAKPYFLLTSPRFLMEDLKKYPSELLVKVLGSEEREKDIKTEYLKMFKQLEAS